MRWHNELVNAQVCVNRAVWAMNEISGADPVGREREDVDEQYVVDSMTDAIRNLQSSRRRLKDQLRRKGRS